MVNTFITSESLVECAKNLDSMRLGKQRVEAYQIINTIEGADGWEHHPVVSMWRGHTDALKIYFNHIVREWIDRGYVNNMKLYDVDETQACYYETYFDWDTLLTTVKKPKLTKKSILFPIWFNWEPFILSHKASLLRKNPEFYAVKFISTPSLDQFLGRGYIWPSKLPEDWFDIEFGWWMCADIGAGAPSHYRITLEEATEWLNNAFINPKTGRKIDKNSKHGMYSQYKKAAKFYKLI